MGRITWLADVLRDAGCKVREVDGWRNRGDADFSPEGVTWHATAGSRNSRAADEVRVLINGSTSAPPPIAQLMLDRDGTFYVVAAGRCNHNKVGWDGPNEGLGNTRLIGIEMANDNRGEIWAPAQVEAARIGTAAIMRRLGADPRRRLAAHFEHQPGAKTDPLGFKMGAERQRVYDIMTGAAQPQEEDDMALTDKIVSDDNESWNRRFGEASARDVRTALAFAAYDSHDAEKAVAAVRGEVADLRSQVTELTELVRALHPAAPPPASS